MATILVIEDDPPLRSILEIALRQAGHTVAAVSNGLEAAALVGPNGRYDLVITDVFMPGMDGLEVMKAFRAHDPTVKVLVISGGGQLRYPDFPRMAKELEADDALAKPFAVDRPLVTVGRLVGDLVPRSEQTTIGTVSCG